MNINLFEKYTLSNSVKLKNSIVMSPMTDWSSNNDYTVSDEEISYYQLRAKDVGMVITGNAFIDPDGIGFDHQFGIWDDKFIKGLEKLAQAIKFNGAKAILQINHSGNKALGNLVNEVVSSSNVKYQEPDLFVPNPITPRPLTDKEIRKVIREFGLATKRAIEAGFDGVELHGAHSFLLQNFESPFYNRRQDEWGRDRLLFAKKVLEEVKKVINQSGKKDFILGYRVTPEEREKDGITLSNTYNLIDELVKEDVTYIHFSLGTVLKSHSHTLSNAKDKLIIDLLNGYVNERTTVIAAGNISSSKDAEKVLKKGVMPAIGHMFVTDPNWIQKIKGSNEEDIVHTVNKDSLTKNKIPKGLWNFIKNSTPWFEIKY